MNNLSTAMYDNCFSFMDDPSLAIFACTSTLNKTLENRYTKNMEKLRLIAWKSILTSSPQIMWHGTNRPEDLLLDKRFLTYIARDKFSLYDRQNQKEKVFDCPPCKKVFTPVADPRFSVLKIEYSHKHLIFYNETSATLEEFELNDSPFIGSNLVFASEEVPGTLQFITSAGNLVSHKISRCESDKTENCEKRKSISCRPANLVSHTLFLRKVSKVKRGFFFEWSESNRDGRKLISITFMADIKDPTNHNTIVILRRAPEFQTASDNNFFYLYYKESTIFTIYKGLEIWKKLDFSSFKYFTRPTSLVNNYYFAAISPIEENQERINNEKNFLLTIWDIRKRQIKPVQFELPRSYAGIPELIVKDELIFIIGYRNFDVFHVPTKTIIASIPAGADSLCDIERTPGRMPTDLIGIFKKDGGLKQDLFYMLQLKS